MVIPKEDAGAHSDETDEAVGLVAERGQTDPKEQRKRDDPQDVHVDGCQHHIVRDHVARHCKQRLKRRRLTWRHAGSCRLHVSCANSGTGLIQRRGGLLHACALLAVALDCEPGVRWQTFADLGGRSGLVSTFRSGVWQEVTEPPLRGDPCPGSMTVTSRIPKATAAAVHTV